MSGINWLTTVVSIAYGLTCCSATQLIRRANNSDVLSWVDPLIGSQSGGNVFAGASLPYGMAKGMSSL